ncbi:MAG: non-canonical purine NTP pyrophosphatase, partial [Xylanibacter rarus]
MKIVFATNNKNKLAEIRDMLGDKIEVMSLADINCHEDIPETADTLEGNALQKARYVFDKYGMSCFADDTGLEVDALGGEPGVY